MLREMINMNVERNLKLLDELLEFRQTNGEKVKFKLVKLRITKYNSMLKNLLENCENIDVSLAQLTRMEIPDKFYPKITSVSYGLWDGQQSFFSAGAYVSKLNNIQELNILSATDIALDPEEDKSDISLLKLVLLNKSKLKKCIAELDISQARSKLPAFISILPPGISEFDVIIRQATNMREKVAMLRYDSVKYLEFDIPDADGEDRELDFNFVCGFPNVEVMKIRLSKPAKSLLYGNIRNYSLKKLSLSRQSFVRFNIHNFVALKQLFIKQCVFKEVVDFMDSFPTVVEELHLDSCDFNTDQVSFHLPDSIEKLLLAFLPLEANFNLNEMANLRELAYVSYSIENVPLSCKSLETLILSNRNPLEVPELPLDLSRGIYLKKLVVDCSYEISPILFPPSLTFLELYNPTITSSTDCSSLDTVRYFSLSDAGHIDGEFQIRSIPKHIKNFRFHGRYETIMQHLDLLPPNEKMDRIKIEIDMPQLIGMQDLTSLLQLKSRVFGTPVDNEKLNEDLSGVNMFCFTSSNARLMVARTEYPLYSNECIWNMMPTVEEWFL
ncbi:unnamed protein product [Ambrosiozyma monospora]|uniref:Unnamed protein product n=1 Tax=Ambrosiozyma monospora TaxID=43982 RepID=A0ACB5T8Q8_AMBMO|nr:unnamed protein product [Ambrosiozyma monospora]